MLAAFHGGGDCVWDIGANVGHYTRLLAGKVGINGRVVAIEPVSSTFRRMVDACLADGLTNVTFKQCALGSCEETVRILVSQKQNGETNSLINRAVLDNDDEFEDVIVLRGDFLVTDASIPFPTILKIDTEGYEEDVLNGMRGILFSSVEPRLRAICMEIHFEILEKRGMRCAPQRIVSLLEDAGFVVKWTDRSHLVAERK
jgi:FkbM family methyltransferase